LLARHAKLAGVAAIACICAFASVGAQRRPQSVEPDGVRVRFPEGIVHGFLSLHTEAGAFLAHGDLIQIPRGNEIESRMSFHFADGSFFEETVTFTQHEVFAMVHDHLIQRGPAFDFDLDATLARAGDYVAKARTHKDGKEQVYTGKLALPADISNGMVIMLAKNVSTTEHRIVHLVAYTPEPRLIELEFIPGPAEKVAFGKNSESAVRFTLKPRLGTLTGFFARMLGKLPPDSYTWIVTEDAPAFARFQGPLFTGPVWRIDLESPTWP
jgi:hypothetical protein